jgi:hypothetical protein
MIDERLRPYATEKQWERYCAYVKHGSYGKAALALGIDQGNLRRDVKIVLRRAAQQGYAPRYSLTHEVPEGLTLKGTSLLYDAAGNVKEYWNKTKVQGRPDEETTHVPDPKLITKVSTLYDQQGQVTQQWVSEKADDAKREAQWRAFAEGLQSELPRAEPVPGPQRASDSLMACYPVGDHHLGMLSWDKETGADYDLAIGERLLCGAIEYLVNAVPSCEQSLIAVLGDFMHYDGLEAKTPTSGHLLDADSRYPKMVRAAIRSIRFMIKTALVRHSKVHVIIEIGNHDLSSSIFLAECLANIYEDEPRVSIDTSPAHYHYFDFGSCLIGTHHGHGVKMEKLPLIMATDRADVWGRTKHRYWWTGHVHHKQSHDFEGCSVESFRILAPTDAWAAQKGYRSIRGMKAITLHKEFGEVARHTVNPEMMNQAA